MIRWIITIFVIAEGSIMATMGTDASEFFPNIDGNLTKITWAHAVNNKTLLGEALQGQIMMIEADIVLGTLINSTANETIPIMGHPPATISDLSLEEFLEEILRFNSGNSSISKGIKLDFKTIEVFSASISILEKVYSKIDYPVWLNADILPGPLNATTTPVNASEFLKKASTFKNSTLSIGWTTKYDTNVTTSYSKSQIQEMVDTITANNVTQPITFPVRAGIAAESIEELKTLLKNVSNSTLTLWSSDGDAVNVTNLRKLIETVGISKTYVDVPSDLLKELHLETISGGIVNQALVAMVLAAVIFVIMF